MNYTTSFLHTARVKYGIEFDSSDINALAVKFKELRTKIELKQHNNVHVGFEITMEHVVHVENLLVQILKKYKEYFHVIPLKMKIYDIIQKIRIAEEPSAKELAKEALIEVLNPEKGEKLTKAEKKEADAKRVSKQRALGIIRKNSAKDK